MRRTTGADVAGRAMRYQCNRGLALEQVPHIDERAVGIAGRGLELRPRERQLVRIRTGEQALVPQRRGHLPRLGIRGRVDNPDTRPGRELRAGLAEVIKYGIIDDAALFRRLERTLPGLLRLDAKGMRVGDAEISTVHAARRIADRVAPPA